MRYFDKKNLGSGINQLGSLVSKFASKSQEEFVARFFSFKLAVKGHTVPRKSLGTFGLFSHKMAFLKSKSKDDLVRVQRHTVRHFKDLE